jgi:hypothetical protein
MKSSIMAFVSIANLFIFCFYLYGFTRKGDGLTLNYGDRFIRARGIVIVDSLGIERAILGSHLPEPNFPSGNRRQFRGKTGSISGLMLYDAEGQERGGYVTDDYYGNAFLTLDSKTTQAALLIAEPQGSSTFQVWSENGKNKVSLSADDDGAGIKLKVNGQDIKLQQDEK